MADCKQCLHYKICEYVSVLGKTCKDFKDRTKWAEKKIGKWDKNHLNDNIVYCDQCYMPQDMPTPFCHSCGAEMVQE